MSKRAIIIARPGSHQRTWGAAFAQGLQRHGWDVSIADRGAKPCDLLIMWGVRRAPEIAAQRARGGDVCILERGYVGDRFRFTSVSFGGALNGRAEFRLADDLQGDPTRWEKYFAGLMRPWRGLGSRRLVTIMGQVATDQAVKGFDIGGWYERTAHQLIAQGWAANLRPHPDRCASVRPIADDLDRSAFVVTWNSNSAVDAVLAGVPTVAVDPGSMAWPVSGHVIAEPPQPERLEWAHALAWKQWTNEEMASGLCWEAVGGEHREQRTA